MKFKKLTTVMLASLLAVSSLSACGNTVGEAGSSASATTEKESTSIAVESSATATSEEEGITFPLEEKLTFTGFAGMNGEYTVSDNFAWKKALERANIEIELTNVLSADLTEKRNLVLASGDYPDVFYKSGLGTDANKYGMQGVFIPLEDLMREYAPNFCALMDETDGWSWITAADGHVYSFPLQNEKVPKVVLWVNKKWLDNLGLKEPTSYEELYEVLKAFKEQDANGNGDPNDEIPFACSSGNLPTLMLYQDYLFDWSTFLGIIDGELIYTRTHESYKEFLAYATKLYEEGLVNQDCFTVDKARLRSMGQTGDVFGLLQDSASFQSVGRDNDDDYIMLTPFQEGTLQRNEKYVAGTLAITDACENPEVIVAWADYFYTEEGGILNWLGEEGETYQVNEDGTWDWILGNGYGDDVTTVRAAGTLVNGQKFPGIQPGLWQKMSANSDEDEVYLNSERRRVYAMGGDFPHLNLTDEENAALSTIKTDVNGYAGEYLAKVVTGEISLEDSWDEYVEMMNQMGAEDMLAIYQAAYDRIEK